MAAFASKDGRDITECADISQTAIGEFDRIETCVREIKEAVNKQTSSIDTIYTSGKALRDSIATLSGINQETTASSEQTLALVNQSLQGVEGLNTELVTISEVAHSVEGVTK